VLKEDYASGPGAVFRFESASPAEGFDDRHYGLYAGVHVRLPLRHIVVHAKMGIQGTA
jgi:hypothetical protein